MHINSLENSFQRNFSRLKFQIKDLLNLKKAILETIYRIVKIFKIHIFLGFNIVLNIFFINY
jgi:hypothetical protein